MDEEEATEKRQYQQICRHEPLWLASNNFGGRLGASLTAHVMLGAVEELPDLGIGRDFR